MELPHDVVRWVSSHFKDVDKEQALTQLRTAVIHTGEPASPRLLRCVVVSSGGDLRRLDNGIQQLRIDWRNIIMAGEYRFDGSNFGNSNYVRVNDFTCPIEDV